MSQRLGAIWRDQRGITGLETAIILIAFVVVASVFAFTVLSTGIFSAERGKETAHAGLEEARGSMEMRGSVTNSVSGEPVDLTPRLTEGGACVEGDPGTGACYGGNRYTINNDQVTVVNFRDAGQRVGDVHWEVTWLGKCQESPCDNLLEESETALVTVWLHGQQDLDAVGFGLAYVKEGQGGDTDGDHLGSLLLRGGHPPHSSVLPGPEWVEPPCCLTDPAGSM